MEKIEVSVLTSLRKCEFSYQEYFELDGVFWYDYDFMCKLLDIYRPSMVDNIYRRQIDDYNKGVFDVYYHGNSSHTTIKRFITTDAVIWLVNRYAGKSYSYILDTILNNEACFEGTLFSDFAHDLNKLGSNPIDDMFIIHEIHESEYYNNMREKYDPSYNRKVELSVKEYREILYELDCEEYEESLKIETEITKKVDDKTDKIRDIEFIREKDKNENHHIQSNRKSIGKCRL